MKLRFDADQDFQTKAVSAAVDLFKGQPAGASDFAFSKASSVGGTFLSVVANNLILDDAVALLIAGLWLLIGRAEPAAISDKR